MKMMPPYRTCVLILTASLLQTLILAQSSGEDCMKKFTAGKEDFVVDTDESVKDGAAFLGSPSVTGAKECVTACCQEPECNLALMENGAQEGSIKSCFLFNCLYKQKKVCRFVRKKGFSNHVLTSVFGSYLEQYNPENKDHPPRALGGQDRVLQPHDTVILSGVESKDDHKIVKFQWVQVSGSPTAVMEKTTFEDEVRVSNLSPGVYKFKLTVTDTGDQSDSTVVTVLVLTPEQTQHHCMVPKKIGPCRGSFPRWHYNVLTKQCQSFTFGGCSPNRNNYLSEKECIQACDQVTVNSTSSRRSGHADLPDEQCGVPCGPEKFMCSNGCCIDKELQCDNTPQCNDGSDEKRCDNLDTDFRRLLDLDKEEDKGSVMHCTLPPVTGPCRHSTTKWYYNPYDQKCSRFNYGGCQGNENQYDSEEECMRKCSKVTAEDAYANRATFEKQEQDSQSVSIAIAVALGLAILILLAVLGYCLLKEKRQKRTRHHPVSANGTNMFPQEDTEKLVYNSTTKPI
ncbi:kunitz-type protease inhibitor 1a [Clarias gariepinus]